MIAIWITPAVLDALAGMARKFETVGDHERAESILSSVRAHPSLTGELAANLHRSRSASDDPDDQWAVDAVNDLARQLMTM